MGVMFLVFVPLPYVDASSAWAFREKWRRAIVGMSGVMVELMGAAIAVIIWANTSTGTLQYHICCQYLHANVQRKSASEI